MWEMYKYIVKVMWTSSQMLFDALSFNLQTREQQAYCLVLKIYVGEKPWLLMQL